MAVTNLTGTKWRLNETIEYDYTFPTYDVDYNAYCKSGAVASLSGLYMERYDSSEPIVFYDFIIGSVLYTGNGTTSMTNSANDPSFNGELFNGIIEFTGGTDVTNTNLIAWLQSNATQITEPEITDLTGTTWLFGESISEYVENVDPSEAPFASVLVYTSVKNSQATYWGNINFSSNGQNFVAIGGEESVPLSEGEFIEVWNSEWEDESYRTITITGGADATNPNFITWLEANAEQIIEPTANEYTLTQNLTNLTNGNITLTITADEGHSLPAQADIVVTGGTIVSYDDETGELVVTAGTTAVEVTCESTVSTISFSIGGTTAKTYQAEDGMTWGEWVASAYNTDGYYIGNSRIYFSSGQYFLTYNHVVVAPSDAILANGIYHAKGGGDN